MLERAARFLFVPLLIEGLYLERAGLILQGARQTEPIGVQIRSIHDTSRLQSRGVQKNGTQPAHAASSGTHRGKYGEAVPESVSPKREPVFKADMPVLGNEE